MTQIVKPYLSRPACLISRLNRSRILPGRVGGQHCWERLGLVRSNAPPFVSVLDEPGLDELLAKPRYLDLKRWSVSLLSTSALQSGIQVDLQRVFAKYFFAEGWFFFIRS